MTTRENIEVFTFLATRFNVTRARELIQEGKAKLVKINPADFKSIIGMIHIDKKAVREADVSEPGILVKFAIPQRGAPDEVFTVLISGWPQAQKLLDAKADSMAVHFFDDPHFVMREIGWMRRPLSLDAPVNKDIDEFEERVGGCGFPS
jgi:hypothetical protein